MSSVLSRLRTEERGSSLILTIFYSAFALLLILIVVAATSLALERKRLFNEADGAALAGADAYDLAAVQPGADGLMPELNDEAVFAAAQDYLAVVRNSSLEGRVLEYAGTPDGTSAEVRLSAAWKPPILTLFVPEGIRLSVTASARSVFR